MEKKRILCLNSSLGVQEYEGYEQDEFNTAVSFFDYDTVLIDSEYIVYEFEREGRLYQNKAVLTENSSFAIKEQYKFIRKQITDFLMAGRNVYVLVGANENCMIYTGEIRYDGTGKNARATSIVTLFNMYSFLPFEIEVSQLYGSNIQPCCNAPFSEFFKKNSSFLEYNGVLTIKENGIPLAKASGSENIVAAVVPYGKGNVVFLPRPWDEDAYESEEEWQDNSNTFLDSILEMNKNLSIGDAEQAFPDWTQEYSILNESELISDRDSILSEIEILKAKLEERENSIRSVQQYKYLFTSSGALLEKSVKQVLAELGFLLFDAEDKRSDIIAKYGDMDIVAEIKGVSKSAAEKHAAQLEKWASLFLEEKGKCAKPILIVNGYNSLPLEKRIESVFPEQMVKYSTSREHALVTTTQLLCLFIEVQSNPECKEERIQELLSTVGIYPRYSDPFEFIER